MNNLKEPNKSTPPVSPYQPRILEYTSQGWEHAPDRNGLSYRSRYVGYDALYHWFDDCGTAEESDAMEAVASDDEEDPAEPSYVSVVDALDHRKHDTDYKIDDVSPFHEPSWTRIRDNVDYISGSMLENSVDHIARRLQYRVRGDAVVLDAKNYGAKQASYEIDSLGQLMHLASNTKSIIEEGLVKRYECSVRDVLNFINAQPGDCVPNEGDDNHSPQTTKWLVEGKFLADALIEIPEFKKNWNTLIIKNAMRYILCNEFNTNSLYRLLAKLGRINTRVIFLG